MTRAAPALPALLALLALPLAACVELGGEPLPEGPPPRWAIDTDTADQMAARAARLADCVPVDDGPPNDPGGLTVAGIRVVDTEGGQSLEVDQLNLQPHGFYNSPRLVVDLRAGDFALPGPDPERYIERFSGIDGCGRNVARVPLPPAADAAGPVRLRASSTGWLPQREWTFTLDPG